MIPTDFLFRPSKHADRIAIESDIEDVTYAELLNATHALAVALQSQDPTPGSTVALCAANSASYIVAMLAIQAAGKAWLPLNYQDTSDNIHNILDGTTPSTILVDENGDSLIHADSDVKIPFSQFPGLVQTYFGQMPARDQTHSSISAGSTGTVAGTDFQFNANNGASSASDPEQIEANRLVIRTPIDLDTGARILVCLAQGGCVSLPDSN